MTAVQAAYIAGIVDGEGCIEINYIHPHIRMQLANTNFELVTWLCRFGGKIYYPRVTNPKWKPQAYWSVVRRLEVASLLSQIEPHLIVKRERAAEALALLRRLHPELA